MLKVRNFNLTVSRRFQLQNLNLTLDTGIHLGVIGESGCGKTSLLQAIYGLFDIPADSIVWKGQSITGPKENLVPGMPYMKYLSQDFDLMPFTTVSENINKYLSRLRPIVNQQRTAELLEVVEMSAFANTKVKTLSGGQKQRVALAQTLAKEPQLLLLDEPFSHIDNFRKNKLRRQLFTYLKKQGISCMVATHDPTDVLSFMDETVVMQAGRILTQQPTVSLYNHPPTYYIGSLFGEINELPKKWFGITAPSTETILIYPHQLTIALQGFPVRITASYFKGDHYLNQGNGEDTMVYFTSKEAQSPGKKVHLQLTKQP